MFFVDKKKMKNLTHRFGWRVWVLGEFVIGVESKGED